MYCIVEFLNKWQTLITGFTTLLAALVGGWLLQQQINQSEKHERNRRGAQEAAGRAVLPLTLSAIVEYVDKTSNILHSLYNSREGEIITSENRRLDLPLMPESAVNSLQSMIEASTRDELVKILAKLIQKIQIHNSRMRSLLYKEGSNDSQRNSIVLLTNIERYVIDSAIIRALAESLFPYARYESEAILKPIIWDDVCRAMWTGNWHEQIHTRLFETIAKQSAISPIVE